VAPVDALATVGSSTRSSWVPGIPAASAAVARQKVAPPLAAVMDAAPAVSVPPWRVAAALEPAPLHSQQAAAGEAAVVQSARSWAEPGRAARWQPAARQEAASGPAQPAAPGLARGSVPEVGPGGRSAPH
jgi:hypothetical protein